MIELIGLFAVIGMFLLKLWNIQHAAKSYGTSGVLFTMVIALIGWGLVFVSLSNGVVLSSVEKQYSVTTPSGAVSVSGENYDYLPIVAYLNIASPLILVCGGLTVLELLIHFSQVGRGGEEKTRKSSFF